MRVAIDDDRCQGHGRCYIVAPKLVAPDELGNGRTIGDGVVMPGLEQQARRAVANCPEHAVSLVEEPGRAGELGLVEEIGDGA